MYSLDIKRCPHCVRQLAAVAVEGDPDFEGRGPALLCSQCDAAPRWENAVFVPRRWTELLG